MMTSSIGSNSAGHCKRRGFVKGVTFIEVMLTCVILAAGLVAIYRAFFIGLDSLYHLSCRLRANSLMSQRMATIGKDFRSLSELDVGGLVESSNVQNREVAFTYVIDLVPIDNLLSVFRLDIMVWWEERGKVRSISRSAFFSGITALKAGG